MPRQKPREAKSPMTVLDVCAGSGGLLRSLQMNEQLLDTGVCVRYRAVEISEKSRTSIQRIYGRVQAQSPTLLKEEWKPEKIFAYGHDLRNLVRQWSVPGVRIPRIDVLCAGVPCQDYSRAGAGRGGKGEKSLFKEILALIKILQNQNPDLVFWVENVPFSDKNGVDQHLRDEHEEITAAFKELGGENFQHSMAPFAPTRRCRQIWSNLTFDWEVAESTEPGALRWQDVLDPGHEVQADEVDGELVPRELAPTVCSTWDTYSMRELGGRPPTAFVRDVKTNDLVRPSVRELERVQGFADGDISGNPNLTDKEAVAIIGNAVVPAYAAHLLQDAMATWRPGRPRVKLRARAAGTGPAGPGEAEVSDSERTESDPGVDERDFWPHDEEELLSRLKAAGAEDEKHMSLLDGAASAQEADSIAQGEYVRGTNDLLYRREEDGWKIVVPENNATRQLVCTVIHRDRSQGNHAGLDKSLDRLRRRFWFNGSGKHMGEVVRSCAACQLGKRWHSRDLAHDLEMIEVPRRPGEVLHIDQKDMPFSSSSGCDAIWIVICRLSSKALLIPYRKAGFDQQAFVTLLLSRILQAFGWPGHIISDNDVLITRADGGPTVARQVLEKEFKCKWTCTSPGHQSANGKAERLIRTLKDSLSTQMAEWTGKEDLSIRRDWELAVAAFEVSYNSQRHRTAELSPHEIMYGYPQRTRIDEVIPGPTAGLLEDEGEPASRWAYLIGRRLKQFQEKTRATLHAAYERVMDEANGEPSPTGCRFTVGDVVKIHRHVGEQRRRVQKNNVEETWWIGPCRVREILKDATVSVVLPEYEVAEHGNSNPIQIRNVIDVDKYHMPDRQLCPDENLLPDPYPPDLPEGESDEEVEIRNLAEASTQPSPAGGRDGTGQDALTQAFTKVGRHGRKMWAIWENVRKQLPGQ